MSIVVNEFNFTGCSWCSVSPLLIPVLRTYLWQVISRPLLEKPKAYFSWEGRRSVRISGNVKTWFKWFIFQIQLFSEYILTFLGYIQCLSLWHLWRHQFSSCVDNKADTELGRMTNNEVEIHLGKYQVLDLHLNNP